MTTPSTTDHKMPSEVWVVSLIGFIVTVGFGVIGPSLPALGVEFGVGTTLMSIAISGFAVARLVANIGFARFLDRIKLRTVLWTGLLLQAVCSVLAALSPDYVGFIILRSVSGVGSAAFTIASSALLLALAPEAVRGRAMSIFAGATALGTVTGPAIGGLLAVYNARLPLIAYGVALALAALATFFLLRSAKDVTASKAEVAPEGEVRGRWAAFGSLFTDRLFVAALMCQLVGGWVYYGMRTTTMPLDLAALGYAVGVIGLLLSIGSFAQIGASTTAGTLSDRIGRVIPISIGLVLTLIALVGLNFAQYFWVAVAAFVFLGLAGGSVVSVSTAMLGDSKIGKSGFGIGAYWVASDAAAIAGPIVSGLLAESVGFGAAYGVAGGLVVLALVYVIRARDGRADARSRQIAPPPGAPSRPELG